jgi:hypothetical protein
MGIVDDSLTRYLKTHPETLPMIPIRVTEPRDTGPRPLFDDSPWRADYALVLLARAALGRRD